MTSSSIASDTITPAVTPFTSTMLENLKFSATNASSYLNPSSNDLLMVLPRLAHRMGSFWYSNVQEHMEDIFGAAFRGRTVAEATGRGDAAAHVAIGALSEAHAAATSAVTGGSSSRFVTTLGFQNVRGFGGMFAYVTSKWALWCILMAIILNRTQIYASARRRLRMHWHLRLAIRIVPVILFLTQVITILEAMRCQSSPDYAVLKYANASKNYEIDFATKGGPFYRVSSTLLFWQDDRQSCMSSGLIPSSKVNLPLSDSTSWNGSLSLLWPLFKTFCLSQFLETLSCALEGRQVQAETGMTLFEHSLAFAEAEAMISAQLGIGPFAPAKEGEPTSSDNSYQNSALAATLAQTRQTILNHVNTPPEVLLIGLISGLSHLTSNLLAIFNLQAKYRLVSTGFYGLCFMSAFLWSFYSFSPGVGGDIGILRFPTVCIVGFIPHLLILVGITICASIYLTALTISALSLPHRLPHPQTITERFKLAHENLQANMQISNIRIHMHEDFYTTLLKLGFMALTAASEAVYLNEGQAVSVSKWTWLEEERLQEYQRERDTFLGVPPELREEYSNLVAEGVGLSSSSSDTIRSNGPQSGYARERKMEKLSKSASVGLLRSRGDGVGASERSGRWLLAYGFFKGIFWLMTGWCAISILKTMRTAGFKSTPRWLRRLARRDKLNKRIIGASKSRRESKPLEFWLLSENGVLSLPDNRNVDVEREMRKQMESSSEKWTAEDETTLDSKMYGWFLHNGWWGDRDESGDYVPRDLEDDMTSVISTTESATPLESDWETDTSSSGRRTPTQREPHPKSSKPNDTTLDPALLARLLDPQSSEDRTEARLLSHRLGYDRAVTRAQYYRDKCLTRSRVLTVGRHLPNSKQPSISSAKLSPEEEEELLEQLIIAKRTTEKHQSSSAQTTESASAAPAGTSSWADGAAGLGAGGPQCVVCQSSPRTVLVWPCRCLSLCEDCRVSLAMNNFGNCVCCRRDVVGFSRIWVP